MTTQAPVSPNAYKRPANIQDVAAALGMHKSTVSQGLSGKGQVSQKTRERIAAVARELGYEPNPLAQRLATNAVSNTVCLCAGTLDLGLMTEKILMIQQELSSFGFEVPVYTLAAPGENPAAAQAKQIRHLCRQQPRAVLCLVQSLCDEVFPELERYQADGGILVAFDAPAPLVCDQVLFDREDNAYQAACYLIEQGHRAIGLAMSSPRRPDGLLHRPQNARLLGFTRALEEAGLDVRPDWVFEVPTYEAGGARLAADFLALRERPTAICIVNDYMALAFMVEVRRAGLKLPHDLSVIGLDNQPIASYCPVPLTSVPQPREQIVEAVVRLVTRRIEGAAGPARTVTVRGEIVERESVVSPSLSRNIRPSRPW